MTVSFAARNDMGCARSNNEDNFYCAGTILTPETRDGNFSTQGNAKAPCLFAVYDGVGGSAEGEYASLEAAQGLGWRAPEILAAKDRQGAGTAIQSYVADVNKHLCDWMREKSSRTGTTLALAVVTGKEIWAYNLGDSRVYVLLDEGFRQVSVDHTLTAQKVRLGVLSQEQALADRDRHTLTQSLGVFEDEYSVMAEAAEPIMIGKACRLLLCTDGLTDMVTDTEMEESLRTAASAAEAVRSLIDRALARGGKDNVTCVAADIGKVKRLTKKNRG